MDKQTNTSTRYAYRRWLLAFVFAGLLATGSFYMPMTATTAYACQYPGGGGC